LPEAFAIGGTDSSLILRQEEMQAEINSITKGYANLGLSNKSSFDSQAFIELKTQYCDEKLCLHCAIGNAILKIT